MAFLPISYIHRHPPRSWKTFYFLKLFKIFRLCDLDLEIPVLLLQPLHLRFKPWLASSSCPCRMTPTNRLDFISSTAWISYHQPPGFFFMNRLDIISSTHQPGGCLNIININVILVSRTRFILRGKDMSEAMRQWRCWFTSWILRQRLLLAIVSIDQ